VTVVATVAVVWWLAMQGPTGILDWVRNHVVLFY
jgi:hypothetical protein